MIPAPEPRVNNPPRSKSQSKSEQVIITHPYIGHTKLGMMCTDDMCTDDVRVTSSNGTCHHRL